MSLRINMQEHIKKSRQSRRASVLARTINLCLFQSQGWPNQCKIPVGMSSISVNLSIPLCVGSGVMDWFCHFCSVHSMLTWKGASRLWGKVIAVPALTLPHTRVGSQLPFCLGSTVSHSGSRRLSWGTTCQPVQCWIVGHSWNENRSIDLSSPGTVH